MAERITSRTNPLMTHIRKLSGSRAYREKAGEYLGDGVKLLQEALAWEAPVTTVVHTAAVSLPALPAGVRAVEVPEDVMRSISPMEAPQGALFLARLPAAGLPEVSAFPGHGRRSIIQAATGFRPWAPPSFRGPGACCPCPWRVWAAPGKGPPRPRPARGGFPHAGADP